MGQLDQLAQPLETTPATLESAANADYPSPRAIYPRVISAGNN